MKKRLCDECGKSIEEGDSYSFVEVNLHVEKCNIGDGKHLPHFERDYDFDSLACLEKHIPKIVKAIGQKEKLVLIKKR